MNTKTVISALVAIALSTGGGAFAQGYGDRSDHRSDREAQRGEQFNRGHDEGRHEGRRDRPDRGYGDERRDERGVGPNHEFHRGDRLPVEYRHRNYVVDDWRGHNLSAPPRGYHWVQAGSDYVLVAIATGVILQLLLGR